MKKTNLAVCYDAPSMRIFEFSPETSIAKLSSEGGSPEGVDIDDTEFEWGN